MRKLIKRFFTNRTGLNRVRYGIGKGMLTHYSPENRTQHLLGLYEREIYPYLKKAMKTSEVLIDIGANDGYYGLCFMKQPGKEVILVEPDIERLDLIENLKLNGFDPGRDYRLIEKYVGAGEAAEIRLDDIIPAQKNTFVLMDIEGAEETVLTDFSFDPAKKVVWLIEVHSVKIEQVICQALEAHGYTFEVIDRAWWRWLVKEERPLAHNRWIFAKR